MKRLMISMFSVALIASNVGSAAPIDNHKATEVTIKYDVPVDHVDVVKSCENHDVMFTLTSAPDFYSMDNHQEYAEPETYNYYMVYHDTYTDAIKRGYYDTSNAPPKHASIVNFKTIS